MITFETMKDLDQAVALSIGLGKIAELGYSDLKQAAGAEGRAEQDLWSEWMQKAELADCSVPKSILGRFTWPGRA